MIPAPAKILLTITEKQAFGWGKALIVAVFLLACFLAGGVIGVLAMRLFGGM